MLNASAGYIGDLLGKDWENGKENVNYYIVMEYIKGVIYVMGLYRVILDTGNENRNYYLGK